VVNPSNVKRKTALLQKAFSHRKDAKDAKKFNIKLGVLGVFAVQIRVLSVES
jgi:hypothetical protein